MITKLKKNEKETKQKSKRLNNMKNLEKTLKIKYIGKNRKMKKFGKNNANKTWRKWKIQTNRNKENGKKLKEDKRLEKFILTNCKRHVKK